MAFFGDPFSIEVHLATVILLGPCATHSDQRLGRISRYLLSPVIDLGAFAVAVVHFVVGVTVLVSHALLVVALKHLYPPSAASKPHPPVPFYGDWWARTMFPSVPFIVAIVLYPGAVAAFFDLIREGEGTTMYIGLVLSALHMLWPMILLSFMFSKVFGHLRYAQTASEQRQGVYKKVFEPKGAWQPAKADWAFVGMRGFVAGGTSFFTKATTLSLPFLLLALVIIVVGIVGAADSFIGGALTDSDADVESFTNCAPRSYGAAAVVGFVALYVAGTQPFRTIIADVLTCCCLASLSVLLIVSGIEADDGYISAASGSRTWAVKIVALMVLAVCSVLRTVHVAYLLIFSRFSHTKVIDNESSKLYIDQFETYHNKEVDGMFEVVDDDDDIILPNRSDKSNISAEVGNHKNPEAVAVVFEEEGVFGEPEKPPVVSQPTDVTPYDDFDTTSEDTSSSSSEHVVAASTTKGNGAAVDMFTDEDSDFTPKNEKEAKNEIALDLLPRAPTQAASNLHSDRRDDELQSSASEETDSMDSRDDKQRAECNEAAFF